VGNGANIAAGSTITKDVPEGKLTINRMNQQMVVPNWQRPIKK
jgi:bifunctional UDP-N-acetylglucosamine pyrophosphorylase/glucosamine-1-phosphate N-acetyltransferase